MKDVFLTFSKVVDLTGRGLADEILSILIDAGLDLNYLVGQGYDGASAMSGKTNGVQVRNRRH